MQTQTLLVTFILAIVFCSDANCDQWSRFRGENGSGLATAKNFPTKWEDKHIRWKIQLPGGGNSSPVIWDDNAYTLCCSDDGATVCLLCVGLSEGKMKWKKEYSGKQYRVHTRSSFASSTPCVDSERVYFSFATPERISLIALNHDGSLAWENDLGTWISQHGYGASPMVYEDKIIYVDSQQAQQMPAGHTPGESQVLAFDSASGKQIWKTQLKATRACYSMPCVVRDSSGKELLVNANTGNGFYAIDPKTGKIAWEIPAFSQRVVASTIAGKDRIFASCGSGGGGNYLTALHMANQPDTAYTVRQSASYVPTAICYEDWLFMCGDRGVVSCVNAQSGEVIWSKRISNGFSSSPVCVNGIIYCPDESGVVHSFKAAAAYEQVDRFNLGEKTQSTPAIAQDVMVLRTYTHLICIAAE